MGPYCTLKTLTGATMPAQALIEGIRTFGFVPMFRELARMAALVANGVDSEVEGRTFAPLAQAARGVDPSWWRIGKGLAQRTPRSVIAHERVIYFLQGLAARECLDDGPTPSTAQLALLMAAANDHLGRGVDGGSTGDPKMDFLADVLNQLRFNRHTDPLDEVARAAVIFSTPPKPHPLGEEPSWSALQQAAFDGHTFSEYFTSFVGPLYTLALTWGAPLKSRNGGLRPPEVSRRTLADLGIQRSLFDDLVTTRAELVKGLQPRADGLVEPPDLLRRKPFIAVDDDLLIASSPTLVTEQLLWPTWARFHAANPNWRQAFGRPVEAWCQQVAREAGASPGCAGTVHTWRASSAEEVEDLVITETHGLMFASVKVLRLLDSVAWGSASRREVSESYERTLFGDGSAGWVGVLRKLSGSIDRGIGRIPCTPTSGQPIVPVLVTLGDLGENSVLYEWVDRRCREERLFTQPGVEPVVFAHVRDFETLMQLMAGGCSVIELLRQVRRQVDQRLNVVVMEAAQRVRPPRLPFLKDRFEEIMTMMMSYLRNSLEESKRSSE